jgi:hypothetical protein
MGLSFHDETSLIEAAGSLRFAADDSYFIPEMGNINQVNDSICKNDDIQEGRSASETIISIELQRDPIDIMVESP